MWGSVFLKQNLASVADIQNKCKHCEKYFRKIKLYIWYFYLYKKHTFQKFSKT